MKNAIEPSLHIPYHLGYSRFREGLLSSKGVKMKTVIERETSLGTTLRLTLEALTDERVRILEYYRKPKGSSQFRRVKSDEGEVLPFSQLGLEESFAELFAEVG